MTILRNHGLLMLIYSLETALFFALLWRERRQDRVRLFSIVFTALFLGGLALGWAMFPFPLR